jgi:hypothetical protein
MPYTSTSIGGLVALELNGTVVGVLASVDGGSISADVVEETVDTSPYVKKHLAGVNFGDVVLTAGFGMDPLFYKWISDAIGRSKTTGPVSAAIIRCDLDLKAVARRELDRAVISSVTFPRLDASSKDVALLTVTVTPENIRDVKVEGEPIALARRRAPMALEANFAVEIGTLDCKRVSVVEALTVKMPVAREKVGIVREPLRSTPPPAFSNLTVTSSVTAQGWRDYFRKFVVEGQSGEENELTGKLTLLTTDLKTPVATVAFEHLGIFSLEENWPGPGAEFAPKLTASFYCERYTLNVGTT